MRSRATGWDTWVGCSPELITKPSELFSAVCANDLEGIVAKWKRGRYYSDGCVTSWLKIRNPEYSQINGRPELFAARKSGGRSKSARPVL
jgi:ATP-dependent DNA ligase